MEAFPGLVTLRTIHTPPPPSPARRNSSTPDLPNLFYPPWLPGMTLPPLNFPQLFCFLRGGPPPTVPSLTSLGVFRSLKLGFPHLFSPDELFGTIFYLRPQNDPRLLGKIFGRVYIIVSPPQSRFRATDGFFSVLLTPSTSPSAFLWLRFAFSTKLLNHLYHVRPSQFLSKYVSPLGLYPPLLPHGKVSSVFPE